MICIDLDPQLHAVFKSSFKGTKPKLPSKLPLHMQLTGRHRVKTAPNVVMHSSLISGLSSHFPRFGAPQQNGVISVPTFGPYAYHTLHASADVGFVQPVSPRAQSYSVVGLAFGNDLGRDDNLAGGQPLSFADVSESEFTDEGRAAHRSRISNSTTVVGCDFGAGPPLSPRTMTAAAISAPPVSPRSITAAVTAACFSSPVTTSVPTWMCTGAPISSHIGNRQDFLIDGNVYGGEWQGSRCQDRTVC